MTMRPSWPPVVLDIARLSLEAQSNGLVERFHRILQEEFY